MKPPLSTPSILPSMGRIVRYVLSQGRNAGQSRAAIVTRTWDQPDTGRSPMVNLTISLDLSNDFNAENHASSVPYDREGKRPGTWHWPADDEQDAAMVAVPAAAVAEAPLEPAQVEGA